MGYLSVLYRRGFLFSLFLLATIASTSSLVLAASLTLTWQDNSTNEDGFNIERGLSGSYAQIASVGPNIQSYTDSSVLAGTTYCYRIRAFNTYGVSSPSNESCISIPITTFALALTKSGTGSGSVTSNPAGITCGSDCSEIYSSGTVVSLTATPATGSTFAGWSGDADCLDGVVTISANKSCTATFNLNPAGYALTVNIVSGLSNGGSGSGTITSSPAGINCGTDCSEIYSSGTLVSLTAIPASGSIFAGWSGDADCLDGTVTLNTNKSCAATFNLNTATTIATLSVVTNGDGTVSSNPSGISCGSQCSQSYPAGTTVKLAAKPGQGAKFAGWTGGGCQGVADCSVALANSTSVSATFVPNPSKIGIFRRSTGDWLIDLNGDGIWDGCNVDRCLKPLRPQSTLPLVGDWTGTGVDKVAEIVSGQTLKWYLDITGDGVLQNCSVDACLKFGGATGDLPVAGDWTGTRKAKVGRFRPSTREWVLDFNGNGQADNCNIDKCLKFGEAGDLPVVGDWTGTGIAKIGVYRPATGEWLLDLNGNGQAVNCNIDKCPKFGEAKDLPVVGDWTGTGTAKIGVYRPATGEWFLDLNGNGQWDDGVDAHFKFVGKNDGDLPVVGTWPNVDAVN